MSAILAGPILQSNVEKNITSVLPPEKIANRPWIRVGGGLLVPVAIFRAACAEHPVADYLIGPALGVSVAVAVTTFRQLRQ